MKESANRIIFTGHQLNRPVYSFDNAQLTDISGENGWKRLPDGIYTRPKQTSSIHEAVEPHVAVYASKRTDQDRESEASDGIVR